MPGWANNLFIVKSEQDGCEQRVWEGAKTIGSDKRGLMSGWRAKSPSRPSTEEDV